jgi:hypothetical protein
MLPKRTVTHWVFSTPAGTLMGPIFTANVWDDAPPDPVTVDVECLPPVPVLPVETELLHATAGAINTAKEHHA